VAALGWLWIAAGAVVAVVGLLGVLGRLPRQHWAGIRLASTLSNDETWAAGHRAGGPFLVAGGVLVTVAGILIVVTAPPASSAAAWSLVVVAILLICAAVAAIRADLVARAVLRRQVDQLRAERGAPVPAPVPPKARRRKR
jgi:uncharacterized membrane protein